MAGGGMVSLEGSVRDGQTLASDHHFALSMVLHTPTLADLACFSCSIGHEYSGIECRHPGL